LSPTLALIVMVRLVRATLARTGAATGSPDEPGYDGEEMP